MNEYDYNKMINDFEFSTRHQAQLMRIRKKWQNVGKKYDETIQRIKEANEENYKKRNAALIKKLKRKEQLLLTALETTNKEKMAEKRKNIELMMEREKLARESVERYILEEEKNRKKFEEHINEKSNIYIYFFFFIIVQSFIERNQKMKEEKHEQVLKKLMETEMRHTVNLDKLNEENLRIQEEKRENALRKYCAVVNKYIKNNLYLNQYWQKKEREKILRKKKREFQNKLQEKEERLHEIDRENEKKRKQLIKKLNEAEKKKIQFDRKKIEQFVKDLEKRKEFYNLTQENKAENAKITQERNENILETETFFLTRASNKDNLSDLKRVNASEKIILTQMTFEKNILPFKKRMNEIKSNNVMKKSSEEQFAIYKEVKRQEAERKKKELEDKLLDKQ